MTHLLAVEGDPDAYRALLSGARAAGMRLGWLELVAPVVDPGLEAALAAGAFRAARVGAGRSLAAKSLAGPAVRRDLVREHFKGCAAVLIAGATDLPRLLPAGDDWDIVAVCGDRLRLDTAGVVARLRRAHIDPR